MKISWVLADATELAPTFDVTRLKDIGSLWGSYRTWRSCQTDNVVCHNREKAAELIAANFQNHCNFYISRSIAEEIKAPKDVNQYAGDFDYPVDRKEEIIAMHLAASQSDIVLLLGFDFAEQPKLDNQERELLAYNYRSLVEAAVSNSAETQWVAVEHNRPLRPNIANFSNFTLDSLDNVFKIFGQL